MNLFRRNLPATRPADPSSTLGKSDVIPASLDSMASRISTSGGAMVDRGMKIYRDNPKLVGGAALIASALLLNRLRSRR